MDVFVEFAKRVFIRAEGAPEGPSRRLGMDFSPRLLAGSSDEDLNPGLRSGPPPPPTFLFHDSLGMSLLTERFLVEGVSVVGLRRVGPVHGYSFSVDGRRKTLLGSGWVSMVHPDLPPDPGSLPGGILPFFLTFPNLGDPGL